VGVVLTFDHKDEAYLRWIDGHQHGFVVNALRNLQPSYLILHKASCGTISGKPARGDTWTSGDYIKICSEFRHEIELWARTSTTGTLKPCALCKPSDR
jgi:hypothetical protein